MCCIGLIRHHRMARSLAVAMLALCASAQDLFLVAEQEKLPLQDSKQLTDVTASPPKAEQCYCKTYQAIRTRTHLNLSAAPLNGYSSCMTAGHSEKYCTKVKKTLSFAADDYSDRCASVCEGGALQPNDSCPCGVEAAAECAGVIAACAAACAATFGADCISCLSTVAGCCKCASAVFGFDCNDC